MFPTKFINNAKISNVHHNAIYFQSAMSNDEIVEMLLDKGIEAFITPDKAANIYDPPGYSDKRILSLVTRINAGCCSFSKTKDVFFLYPITLEELKNVGLNEEDLVEWLHYLNSMEAGFNYLYFGKQPYPKAFHVQMTGSDKIFIERRNSKDVFWVGVPSVDKSDSQNKPYLHWIALRYLINTTVSNNSVGLIGKDCKRLAYYNIPRITMFFHKEFKLPKLRAFLYAHIANPFYSYYSLAFSDYMGYKSGSIDFARAGQQAPCVHVTREQFKAIFDASNGLSMNPLLTQMVYDGQEAFKKIRNLKNLAAPYDFEKLFQLFEAGKYQEFVNEIKESYKTVESNITRGKTVIKSKRRKINEKKVLAK